MMVRLCSRAKPNGNISGALNRVPFRKGMKMASEKNRKSQYEFLGGFVENLGWMVLNCAKNLTETMFPNARNQTYLF